MTRQQREDRAGTSTLDSTTATLEDFAAELAEAAYPVALRRQPGRQWLDLELDLWHAMAQTVKSWQQHPSQPFTQ
jgi:hypothetical protein